MTSGLPLNREEIHFDHMGPPGGKTYRAAYYAASFAYAGLMGRLRSSVNVSKLQHTALCCSEKMSRRDAEKRQSAASSQREDIGLVT